MSRRGLLSLLCLSVLLLSLVQLTHAGGEIKVDESRSRVLIQKEPVEVDLVVANSTGETLNANVQVELLNPQDGVEAQTSSRQQISSGNQTLKLSLPFSVTTLSDSEHRELIWYRLRYRLTEAGSGRTITEGIFSLSQSPDLFELRLLTSELAREGSIYHVRVNATHPITQKPAAKVTVTGELLLEDNDDHSVKLQAEKITNSEGFAVLEFQLPPRFPQFPHATRPSGGEIKLIGRRGSMVAKATADVLVDQFAHTLITPDKRIYQPGQTMHVRALMFTPSRRALANQKILVRICDPEEVTVFRDVVTSSRFGIVTVDWPIPENTRLGDYRIWVGVEGEETYTHTASDVRISRYDLPNFSVSVEPDRGYYLAGQNAVVRVRAGYLFGQPVTRGHVRVVRESEREWNYREQKWDVVEGDKYEGDTDPSGTFVAHIDLKKDHEELEESDDSQFTDVTYAAYFTDPTTNRTEQRRFDVRVTKDPIHVYVLDNYDFWRHNRTLPLSFYVTAFYADGSPARCKLNLSFAESSDADPGDRKQVATLRTNRYGAAKASAIRLPRDWKDLNNVYLTVSAVDGKGQKGSKEDEISLADNPEVRVETDKSIYRSGEPINAVLTSNVPDQTLFVDVMRDSVVIRNERVEMHHGRALVTIPYRPEFKNKISVAAYSYSPKFDREADVQTVLYPQNLELNVKAQPSQATYRPGEDAQIKLSVQAPQSRAPESALGVVVIDKAVDERFRSDQESGRRYSSINDSLQSFLGIDQQLSGVTMRDLQRLDTAKFISPDLDLVAEILLSYEGYYAPNFSGGDQYETDLVVVFSRMINDQIKPVHEALNARYLTRGEYPRTEAELRAILSDAGIDFANLRDPWGNNYRPFFEVSGASDMLTLISAGADERFDTGDDFSVDRSSWRYFLKIGGAIERAVKSYHQRTGGFILDEKTLRAELSQVENSLLDNNDRWGQPYRLQFAIVGSNYELRVSSSGPDKRFSTSANPSEDDFTIWITSMDYFAEHRERLQAALAKYVELTKKFPTNDAELREALRDSNEQLGSLRDPWGNPYYTTFNVRQVYADQSRIENRGTYGQSATQQVTVSPVTRSIATIALRSAGPDGREGTSDDFSVATFNGTISEQTRVQLEPQTVRPAVFNAGNGAILGTVSDQNGARIPNATVTATRAGDEKKYQATTNDEGTFTIANLPPGFYEVRFEALGFRATVFTNVPVGESNLTEVNAQLTVGAVAETVQISSDGPPTIMTGSSASISKSVSYGRMNIITKSGASQLSTPRLREYFPETLLWQPSIETDKQGRAQINFRLADNITTWKLAVIGSTEDGRIGATETDIKAFQPFFVEHDPPRVLTQGDEISLPVVVRNYLDREQKVDLEIKPENWFTLLGPAHKQATVPAGDAKRETFDFRAVASVDDGKQRVTASGNDANDAIEKPVKVHPDGEELMTTAGDILGASATLELNLPETMIPDWKRGELKIYPNLMAHVIESVEAIMARPYGCAEQSISSTYPSLLLLRNQKQTGEEFRLRARAQRYVNDGYSRLLNYSESEGGFSYWGRGEPDVAVTAYALRFLMEASDVIAVDQHVIDDARAWLLKKQQADGSWKAHEYWSGTDIKRRSALLTAYVTRVLAMTADRRPSDDVSAALKRAFGFLKLQAAEIDEPYLLASYALAALEVKDTTTAGKIVEKLRAQTHSEGTTAYWSLETNTPFYGWGMAGRVETTALVVRALAGYCASQTSGCEDDQKLINRGLVFLLKQKDSYGVWYSTQATINVLDALLALFSANKTNEARESAAEIVVNGRIVQTITIPAERLSSPISFDLSPFLAAGKNLVEIKRPSGGPLASLQAVANYYVPWKDPANVKMAGDLRLLAKFDKTESTTSDEITCHVEAERVGFRGYGMLLAEIGLPPGADVDRSSLETAMTSSGWSLTRYDVLPDRVVLYLWPRAGGVKFDFKFRPRFGLNAKNAASVIYDYYNPESRMVVPPAIFKIK
jgi:hypothetical protein